MNYILFDVPQDPHGEDIGARYFGNIDAVCATIRAEAGSSSRTFLVHEAVYDKTRNVRVVVKTWVWSREADRLIWLWG